MNIRPPHVDGEKIPSNELERIFRPPPDVDELRRNTLLVGARGAGKTTLLSHLFRSEQASTVYVSLVDVVGGVAKNTLPTSTPSAVLAENAERQQARSACFTIAWLLQIARTRGWLPAFSEVAGVLPNVLLDGCHDWTSFFEGIDDRLTTDKVDISVARKINERSHLQRICMLLGEGVQDSDMLLKLLFDRADAVPLPCALPILELLDQTGPYMVLVATRPAPHADLDWGERASVAVMPDDQYDVVPLGAAPRDAKWRSFVKAAVIAQLPQAGDPLILHPSAFDAIIYYASDSVRLALQLTHQTLKSRLEGSFSSLIAALEARQAEMLNRATARLQNWDRHFQATREQWRELALQVSRRGTLDGPVHFDLRTKFEQVMLSEEPPPQTLLDRFIAACLQDSVLRAPHGKYWYPGARFTQVEAAPLLLWEKVDGADPHFCTPISITLSGGAFMGAGGGGSGVRSGQVFVALRFTFNESVAFFQRLRSALSHHPMLGKIHLRNGQLPSGAKWATEIRTLVKKCTLLTIGDVTGGRGDVLFELGIATGLGRPIIPVVADSEEIQRCPYWLRAYNVGVYGSDSGVAELVSSIFDHVYKRKRTVREKLPIAVPNVIGFIGERPWNEHHIEQLRSAAAKEGVRVEALPSPTVSSYDEAVQLAARASLLVLALDNTESDAFAHFASGIVVARPTSGFGKHVLDRSVILVPEGQHIDIPDSLIRAQPIILVATDASTFVREVKTFLRRYSVWRRSAP